MVNITIEDIKKGPEADLLVNYIVDRRHKGLYSLVLVHGLPGTGKSSTCFRLIEKIQEPFKDKLKINFRVIDKMKDVALFVRDAKEDELWIGILEELSTLFPARRSMSGDNVDVQKILDTCRKKKVILLANAPIWTSIDSHIRMLGNIYIETIKVYKKAKIVVSRFYRLQTNPQTGKTYLHSFLRKGKETTRLYTIMPNLQVWNKYEKTKDIFMDTLYTKIIKRAEKREEKENKELGITQKRKATPLSPNETQVYSLRSSGLKYKEISAKIGTSVQRAHEIYTHALKKLNFVDESHQINP